jgi:hypothetical protein
MVVQPLYTPNIVKKRTKRFKRHQSDRYKKLKVFLIIIYLFINYKYINNLFNYLFKIIAKLAQT